MGDAVDHPIYSGVQMRLKQKAANAEVFDAGGMTATGGGEGRGGEGEDFVSASLVKLVFASHDQQQSSNAADARATIKSPMQMQ